MADAIPESDKHLPGLIVSYAENPRTIQDTVSVRELLLNFFPPELVYLILNFAEYWVQVTVVRADEITVSASSFFNAEAVSYLETPRIVDHERCGLETIRLQVARVHFTI
ncbi:hypothetical protein K438DRAFT_1978640 [Mycena galopus ATCC 62051]|nr:hypothetical protein K438DRAFT_1978640 [Mycena galopus ATCC 62051]